MWTLVRIAFRNVVRNRRRTLITLAAILVGVGVMVTIRGFLNGLQGALISGVVDGQTGALQIHRAGYMKNVLSSPLTLDFAVDPALLAKVKAVKGVKEAAPRIAFVGMASSGDDTLVMQSTALDPELDFKVCPARSFTFNPGARFGNPPPPKPADWKEGDPAMLDDGVILTSEMAQGLHLKPNVQAAILAPDRDGALSGENIQMTGTMTVSIPGQEKVGLIPLALAQRLLKMEGHATELAIRVDDVDHVPRIRDELAASLGSQFEVSTWNEVATFVDIIRQRQELVLTVVSASFMFIMLLGVANTMLMSVFERTREIGTMMAVGVTREKIMQLFLIEAAGLGALGGVIGAAVGAVAVAIMGHHGIVIPAPGTRVPFTVHPAVTVPYVLFVIAIAAFGSVIFASYPAWRASRLRPVEALAGV